MKITVHDDGTSCDVSLLTDDLAIDLAVRFECFDEAKAFAELWADWIECDAVEVTRTGAARTAA